VWNDVGYHYWIRRRRQQTTFKLGCQFRVKTQGNLGGFGNNLYLKNGRRMVYGMGKPCGCQGLNKLGHLNARCGN